MTDSRAILVGLLLLSAAPVLAVETEWSFDNWDGPEIPVRMFVPDDAQPDTRIVIVMHGMSRDAKRYYRDWKTLGKKHGLIIVVPEFTKRRFRTSHHYNLGHVFDRETGERRPEDRWTFSAIEPLFDDVVSQVNGRQTEYTIYGHSAGSQFVHRYLYYKPNARVARYIAANAGWYTVPVNDFEYPYGLTNSGLSDKDLPAIFAKNMIILLGREDTDENDKSLRKTSDAMQQGPNRLARGLTMFRVAKARAEELGVAFNWQIYTVKGADHVNAKMAPAAAAFAAE